MVFMINDTEIKKENLVLLVFGVEGVLFLVALLWSYLAKINPFSSIHLNYLHILIAVLAGGFLIVCNYLAVNELSKFITFFKKLKEAYEEVAILAVNVNLSGALIIALISGFTEEFFFRGVIQQQFGIIIASLAFGLLHIGNAKTLVYGLYTVFVGFYLGWLFSVTGNLLVPIIVHIINNFLALPYMRYYYNKYVKNSGHV